jgi:hypothetical protein
MHIVVVVQTVRMRAHVGMRARVGTHRSRRKDGHILRVITYVASYTDNVELDASK